MANEILKHQATKIILVLAVVVVIIGFMTDWTFKFKKYAMGGRVAEGPNPVTHPVPNPTPVQQVQIPVVQVYSTFCNEVLQMINSTQNVRAKNALTNLYNTYCSNTGRVNVKDFCQELAGIREQWCGPDGDRNMCAWLTGWYNRSCGSGARVGGNDSIACAKKCDSIKDDNAWRSCMANCSNA